jgi:hypothetical protein
MASVRLAARCRANSIVNWFVAMFAELRIDGCSSHSGRRTFITTAVKNVHRAGGSLRDVQLLAGHQSTPPSVTSTATRQANAGL